MSARLRAAWAGARSWWEYHVGPLPRCLRTSECYRVPRWWFRLSGKLYGIRWCIIAAALNRFAPAELRHAALLLGYDFGQGVGDEGFLGHLHEFSAGAEAGYGVRFGDVDERGKAAETFALERSIFNTGRGVPRVAR